MRQRRGAMSPPIRPADGGRSPRPPFFFGESLMNDRNWILFFFLGLAAVVVVFSALTCWLMLWLYS